MAIAGMTLTIIPFISVLMVLGRGIVSNGFGSQDQLAAVEKQNEPAGIVDSEIEENRSIENNHEHEYREESKDIVSADKLYRVQAGAFSSKSNALELEADIRDHGIETSVVEKDGLYVVYVGAFKNKENAEKRITELQSFGFDAFMKSEESKRAVPADKLYRVQAGAFSSKSNALELEANIRDHGIETSVVEKDGLYVVYAGAFKNKENAEKRITELQSFGFDAFIKHQ
ncbi:SPOR domain-containing protein [Bacillus sp. FJAT-52991]|uniref:SPOR domain-containing protein n=1 Tax=Bacillus kandeliae TaxID=3129297 RepID=A0ABZ2N8H2_9BACI